jgi:hypothetical protein
LPNNLLHIFLKQGSRSSSATHQVEKFRYVVDDDPNQAYREFLATFAHVEAAADGDPVKMKSIQAACDSGGDFVGEYYFQYEVQMSRSLIFFGLSTSPLAMFLTLAFVSAKRHSLGVFPGLGAITESRSNENSDGIRNVPPKDITS